MQNPYFSLLATAWKNSRTEKKRYLLVYLLFIGASCVSALNPLLYGWFIGDIQKKGSHILGYAWIYAGAYMGLKLVEWAFHGPARVMERKLAFNLSKNYIDGLFHQLLQLPIGWHKDHHSGSTINRIRKAYTALKSFFESGFVYLQTMLKFIFSFAAMVYYSPLFGTIGVFLGILTIWVIYAFDKPYIKSLEEVNEGDHAVSSNLFDSLSNIMTVITLRLENRVQKGLSEKINAVFQPFVRNVIINEWKWFTAQILVAIIYSEVVLGYIFEHYHAGKPFELGPLVTLLGFVALFTSVFYDFAQQYTQIVQYNTDIQTARVITESFEKEHRASCLRNLSSDWQQIRIKNLNFYHKQQGNTRPVVNARGILDLQVPTSRRYGLKELNIEIIRGKRIALVGESGCGKSTLLALLRGLYTPNTLPEIEVDGVTGYSIAAIADIITLLPQEPEIFEDTFRYNITLGLPFSTDEVNHVCEITSLAGVLENSDQGLDAIIVEKGMNLSGGQKQRLALARGVLAAQASSIVLLDEPTSSMDARTEQAVYVNLFKEFEGKTVISSLHRLHLLVHFDYIYVLDKGRIAEEGTLTSLLNNSILFNNLWNHQQKHIAQ